MLRTKQETAAILPQKEPMTMVDQLVAVDDNGASSILTIRENNIFVKGGAFLEPGIIEHIAQTAAAREGHLSDLEGKPSPVGFIGAITKLHIHQLPLVGDMLNTSVHILHQIMNATVIEGKVESKGQLVASCEMKIFIQP